MSRDNPKSDTLIITDSLSIIISPDIPSHTRNAQILIQRRAYMNDKTCCLRAWIYSSLHSEGQNIICDVGAQIYLWQNSDLGAPAPMRFQFYAFL